MEIELTLKRRCRREPPGFGPLVVNVLRSDLAYVRSGQGWRHYQSAAPTTWRVRATRENGVWSCHVEHFASENEGRLNTKLSTLISTITDASERALYSLTREQLRAAHDAHLRAQRDELLARAKATQAALDDNAGQQRNLDHALPGD